jgi:hypothetical protein
MAFGADELRVLRRALAAVLHPAPLPDEDIRACLALAESVDEAVREAGRLRAFLLADLARYRDALPGSFAGYVELLQDALSAGYGPVPDDLAALRALRADPVAAALLDRCEKLAEKSLRERLAGPAKASQCLTAPAKASPRMPAPRTRLLTLVNASEGGEKPKPAPRKPAPARPARPGPATPPSERPVPKPSEVFPPRRKPAPPPQERAAG